MDKSSSDDKDKAATIRIPPHVKVVDHDENGESQPESKPNETKSKVIKVVHKSRFKINDEQREKPLINIHFEPPNANKIQARLYSVEYLIRNLFGKMSVPQYKLEWDLHHIELLALVWYEDRVAAIETFTLMDEDRQKVITNILKAEVNSLNEELKQRKEGIIAGSDPRYVDEEIESLSSTKDAYLRFAQELGLDNVTE